MFLEKEDRIQGKFLAELLFSATGSIKGCQVNISVGHCRGSLCGVNFYSGFYAASSHDCRHRPLKALFLVIMVFLPVGLPNERNRRCSGLGRHV